MRRMKRLNVIVVPFVLLSMTAFASACPMCKDSIPGASGPGGDSMSGSTGGSLPGGFNTSVYMMLIGFLGCLGLVTKTIVQAVRTTDASQNGFPVVPDRRPPEAKPAEEKPSDHTPSDQH